MIFLNKEELTEIFNSLTKDELIDYFGKISLLISSSKKDEDEESILNFYNLIISLSIDFKQYDLTVLISTVYSTILMDCEKYEKTISYLNDIISIMRENSLIVNEAILLLPLITSYLNNNNIAQAKETQERFQELYFYIENPSEELRFQYCVMSNR